MKNISQMNKKYFANNEEVSCKILLVQLNTNIVKIIIKKNILNKGDILLCEKNRSLSNMIKT